MPISSTGVGSGLDVESIVTQLMAIERRPVTLLQNAATDLKAQLSSFGQMQSYMSAFRDKANALTSTTLWGQTVATASIVNAASGARLSLRSTSTGLENGFRVTATETVDDGNPATGLSALGYNGEGLSPMSLNQKALNAEAKINGIDIVSASNTLANVADGLTVKLLKTTTSAVDVSVTQDTDAVKTAINGFVSAYNDLNGFIRTQTKYNPDSKVAGTLQGDRTAVGLQNQLRSVLRDSSTASALYTRFSDVGIEIQKDGSLQVKAAKLTDALGNLADLRKVLASTDDSTATSTGIVQRFKLFADQVLDTDGALQTRTDGLNLSVKLNSQRQDALNSRMDETEKRLRAQYQTLDANMAKLSQLSGYVNQQLSSLRFNNN